MAIDKGNIKTSANYDVRAQKPMEARREKPRKVDLITKESWSYDGNTIYAHEGLQVYVREEKKTYILVDLSKIFEPDYSGWDEMLTTSTSGESVTIEVDDELSFESTNPVQNKVVTENLDGIMHLDLDLSTLDSAGLESLYAQLVTLIGDSGRVKSFYCSYKGDVVKVDRLSMIGETTYVFVSKGVHQYVLIGNGLAELPWVFTWGENNGLSYLGLQNVSKLCKEAVIDIDGIRYPVTSYECKDSYITLYAFVKDYINQYKVDSNGGMTLVSSESIIGGSITLDSEMSDTSENAVGNKVIKEYVDKSAPRQFGDDFAEDFN